MKLSIGFLITINCLFTVMFAMNGSSLNVFHVSGWCDFDIKTLLFAGWPSPISPESWRCGSILTSFPVGIPITYSISFLRNELPLLGKDARPHLNPFMSTVLSKNLGLWVAIHSSSLNLLRSLLKRSSLSWWKLRTGVCSVGWITPLGS